MPVRGWAIAAGAGFALAVILSVVGGALGARGRVSPAVKTTFITATIVSFVAIALAVPPLAVRAFLAGQVAIGNGSVPVIAFLTRHESGVVRGIWIFMASGLAIALPAILRELGVKV